MKIKILIPIYNDWKSVSKLVDEINGLSIDPKFQLSVIIINDASIHLFSHGIREFVCIS